MTKLSFSILLVVIILILHLIEELKTGFRKKYPLGEMPKALFIGINIIIYSFCAVTFSLSLLGHDMAIPFAWILALAMIVNGFGHIAIMVYKREYFPGGITAILLLLASSYLVFMLISKSNVLFN